MSSFQVSRREQIRLPLTWVIGQVEEFREEWLANQFTFSPQYSFHFFGVDSTRKWDPYLNFGGGIGLIIVSGRNDGVAAFYPRARSGIQLLVHPKNSAEFSGTDSNDSVGG